MDPNAALAEIREIISGYDPDSDEHDEAGRLVDLVEGLDDWLSKGGALPEAWRHERHYQNAPHVDGPDVSLNFWVGEPDQPRHRPDHVTPKGAPRTVDS